MPHQPKPIVLAILDGWGYSEKTEHNPTRTVATPTLDDLWEHHPHALLVASGTAVGLPEGQIGNSEVGHLHLGGGRRIPQELCRVSEAIASGAFEKNPVLQKAMVIAKRNNAAVHILGLLSPGGVHSHQDHIFGLIEILAKNNIKNYTHAFLDGRDVPPRSAKASLEKLDALYQKLNFGRITTITGRYYAMDRDQRWDRVERAYDLLTIGKASFHAASAVAGLEAAYARNENDEFVKPTAVGETITIQDNDVVIFMNFRADRARQLSLALTSPNFSGFARKKILHLGDFVTLTEYSTDLSADVLFPPMNLKNTLGEVLSQHHLKQLRLAETEKYAHVTYFFNGGNETAFPGEERQLVPSPKVATYDLQPEMSAITLTDQLVDAIHAQKFDVIICNYANPDMVGHTGIESAAEKAMQTIDICLARVLQALKEVSGELLLTADHGNVECMYDEQHHQPHTAHTTNLVPFIYFGRNAVCTEKQGTLADVAPTLLYLLGIAEPKEMTGRCLLKLEAQ